MESLSRAEQERIKTADMRTEDYLVDWLDQYKNNLSPTTLHTYKMMVETRMVPYFKSLNIPLKDVTGDELNRYYNQLRDNGVKGATAQRHHSLLHLAFKHAVKRRVIPSNPCDQADRPKSTPYIGTYYNAAELKELFDCLDGDPLRIVIILTTYYGLRRSEAVGIKWDAIDFTQKTISIRHKVVENSDGIIGLDVMKTKSSHRTLPLIPYIEEELRKEQAHQVEMKRIMRSVYNKKYTAYVCVDAIGDLIRPRYVSEHFKVILKQNKLREIRFHDLRHSCASLMLANGVAMKMIQDWLGHSDMSTTANIYSHIDSKSKLESANMIEVALSQK